MESLRELYRIGYGPSSSHTMGPRAAMERFIGLHPEVEHFQAELYGSLAATGKGHLTDRAIREVCSKAGKELSIKWYPDIFKPFHPNALTIKALDRDGEVTFEKTYYSIGGGKIVTENRNDLTPVDIYPKERFGSMARLLDYCSEEGLQLWEAVLEVEGPELLEYIKEVWETMKSSIESGSTTRECFLED